MMGLRRQQWVSEWGSGVLKGKEERSLGGARTAGCCGAVTRVEISHT